MVLAGMGEYLAGFVKKNQPLIEHQEIFLRSLVTFLAWYFVTVQVGESMFPPDI